MSMNDHLPHFSVAQMLMCLHSISTMKSIVSTAPGRLCLFGEHSDYLNLPVIAVAIPLQCEMKVTPTPNSRILEIKMVNIDANNPSKVWKCDLDNIPASPKENGEMDFALAAVHEVVVKDGWKIPCGAKCVSTTDIPLQSGCSSSSAFVVAWIQVLAKLAGKSLEPLQVAHLAHRAEVMHFGAPGGTMDHVTSALGGVVRIGPGMWEVQRLSTSTKMGVWVLADSGQPKDTMKHLRRCKQDRLNLFAKLGNDWNATETSSLSDDEIVLLEATQTNLITEQEAASKWSTARGEDLGALMLQHHYALRDGLLLSTDRLEDMREAALKNGAWGYKLVGSGGGGCAVAWCSPERAEAVAKAMEEAGAVRTYQIIEPFHGAMVKEQD